MGSAPPDLDRTTPLGPALGRLARPANGSAFDPVRLALIDRLVGSTPSSGEDWVAAWREAATALADQVLSDGEAELRRAATNSRLPEQRLRPLLPGGAEREVLIEKLVAAAIPLEELVNEPVTSATTRNRGAALEAAWDASVQVVRGETARWRASAGRVAAWRRPWRQLVLAAIVLVPLTTLVAAWLGGWVAAPAWFQPAIDQFWRLPWP